MKDSHLWKKLASRNLSLFSSMTISMLDLEMIDTCLGDLLKHSGCKNWVVEVGAERSDHVKGKLEACIGSVSFEFRQIKGLDDVVKLWPKVALLSGSVDSPFASIGESLTSFNIEQRILRIGLFFCRTVCSIVHRVLQYFSKEGLKSDSSNTSFISFLSCHCFEKALENRISFRPVIPSKFFPVENASRKVGRGSSMLSHLWEKHADKAVELVASPAVFVC